MSENTASAACSEFEWRAAREAGLPFFTTSDERAIRRFALSIREEQQRRHALFIASINAKLDAAYGLVGRYELTDKIAFKTQAEALFAEVRREVCQWRDEFSKKDQS